MNASPTVGKLTLATGVRWVASSRVLVQMGRLVLVIILARILVPEDFGVVSLVMIITAFIEQAIGDVGTAAAIVQRQDMTDDEVSSMFWFNIGVGILLTVVAEIAAPLMSHTVDHPHVVDAFRVVAFSFAIAGFRMTHMAVLRKSLRYRTLAILDVVSLLANVSVALSLAIAGAGFWALLLGTMAANVALTIGVWVVSDFRPAFSFQLAHLRSVAGFSLNLSGYRFINFFAAQGDRFIVGTFISTEALGFYSQANRLVRYPLDTATFVYRRVLVPAMSKDQDNDAKVRMAFLRSTGVIAVAVVPFTLTAAVLAEPLILALPGEKWLPAVPLIRLLAVVGLFTTVTGQTGVIFHIKGRTDLLLYWGIVASTATMTGYIVGLQWGVEGVAWGYLAAMAIITIPSYYLPLRLINTPIKVLLPVFRGIAGAGGALVVTAYLMLQLTGGPGVNSWIPLTIGSATGGMVYLIILVMTRNQSLIDLAEIGSPKLAKRISHLRS